MPFIRDLSEPAQAPAAQPGQSPADPTKKPLSWPRTIAAGLARYALPIGATIAGTPLLGAGAAAIGEAAAEKIEGKDFDPADIALSGAAMLVPGGKLAKYVKGPISGALARGAEGMAFGGAYDAAHSLVHGETPSAKSVALGAAGGALFGAGLGAIEGKGATNAAKAAAEAAASNRKALTDAEIREFEEKIKAALASGDPAQMAAVKQEVHEAQAAVHAAVVVQKPKGKPKPVRKEDLQRTQLRLARQREEMALAGKVAHSGVNAFGELQRALNPASLAEHADVDKLVSPRGKRDMFLMRTTRAYQPAYKMFEKLGDAEGLRFIDNFQNHRPQPDEWRELDKMIRQQNAWVAENFKKYKKSFVGKVNYFPHLWKDRVAAEAYFSRKGSWQGSQRYFNQRTFDTMAEGIEKGGLEPISHNPVVLQLSYLHDATKFIAANEAFDALKQANRLLWIPQGKVAPQGWAHIDDAIARKFLPAMAQPPGGKGFKVKAQIGQWATEEPTARLINNMLGRDYIRESPTLRGAFRANALLNALQLGFSAWHAAFIGVDSMASEVANALSEATLGMGKLASRETRLAGVKQLRNAAKRALTAPVAAVKYGREGHEFFKAGAGGTLEGMLEHGGANLQAKGQYFMPAGWGSWDNFVEQARRGNVLGRLAEFPFAATDLAMKPLFEHAIPRIKVGAFSQLMKLELERNARALESGVMSEATLARKTWANVENRLGELNYDNLFWNQTFKTAMQLSFRAVGFNVGTVRELGGGIFQDIPKFAVAALQHRTPELTPKMQYVMGLTLAVTSAGAVYHKLHTGENPQTIEDYLYPKNGETDEHGNPVRVMLPSYFKDASFFSHPATKIAGKLSPIAQTMFALFENRDFKNDYIYNEGAGLSTQAKQLGKFLMRNFEPFSLQQFGKLSGSGKSTPAKLLESITGIAKAPRDVSASPGLTAIRQKVAETHAGRGPALPEAQVRMEKNRAQRDVLQKEMGMPLRPEDRAIQQLQPLQRAAIRAAHPELTYRPNATPTMAEFDRLGILIPKATQIYKTGNVTYDLPPDVSAKLAKSQGEQIDKMMKMLLASPEYKKMDEVSQKRVVELALKRARNAGYRVIMPDIGRLMWNKALKVHGSEHVDE